MKQLMVLGSLLFIVVFSGCVQSQFIKSIQVEKDANGKIVKVTEIETAIQPTSAWPIKFEHLKGVQYTGPFSDVDMHGQSGESGQSAPKFPRSK